MFPDRWGGTTKISAVEQMRACQSALINPARQDHRAILRVIVIQFATGVGVCRFPSVQSVYDKTGFSAFTASAGSRKCPTRRHG